MYVVYHHGEWYEGNGFFTRNIKRRLVFDNYIDAESITQRYGGVILVIYDETYETERENE